MATAALPGYPAALVRSQTRAIVAVLPWPASRSTKRNLAAVAPDDVSSDDLLRVVVGSLASSITDTQFPCPTE